MQALKVRQYQGLQAYQPVWQAMQKLTNERDKSQLDELWLLQHERVFTQGVAGKAEHVLAPGDIPVVQVDRGGQVTYHGPGQLVAYLMLDIRRLQIGVRELVTVIESSVISCLSQFGLTCYADPKAPGVYIDGKKIASLGLRIRRGCSFHGLAINVDMDLEPFARINPCGYQGLEVTHMAHYVTNINIAKVTQNLVSTLQCQLNYQVPSPGDQ